MTTNPDRNASADGKDLGADVNAILSPTASVC
jgi:hypothetical protein